MTKTKAMQLVSYKYVVKLLKIYKTITLLCHIAKCKYHNKEIERVLRQSNPDENYLSYLKRFYEPLEMTT